MPPGFLNSREDAILIWTVLILGYALLRAPREIGESFAALLRTLVQPKFVLLFGSAAAYCAGVVVAASKLDLWHTSTIKETVYWFVGTGVVLVGRAVTARSDEDIFKAIVRSLVRVTIVIEFIVNLYVFPLAVEIVLVFLVFTFGVLQVLARNDASIGAPTRKLIDGVLVFIGWVLLISFAVHAVTDPQGFLSRENAERLLVVPALTVTFIPFLFAAAWYSQREQANLRKQFGL